MKLIEKEALRPPQPIDWIKNPVEWLSNFDIDKVMKQYEKYPIYKYKPPITNSIDVYLNYKKNIQNKIF